MSHATVHSYPASPLAHAFSNAARRSPTCRPRPLDCLLVAVMAAVALVALLAGRARFAQVGRIGGWLP